MHDRRKFLQVSAAALGTGAFPLFATAKDAPRLASKTSASETAVKSLFDTLSEKQKKEICFAWNHEDATRGLLRTHVSNNWQITKPVVKSDFFTKEQQGIVADIFKGLVNPEWHAKFLKQLKDDSGGKPFGSTQSIAIFGEPGSEQFQFVMTGRHQTIRADGNTEKHVAFGGPIFYGHAGKNDNEEPTHPDNVFWEQAVAANGVFKLLDEKQRMKALVGKTPKESAVAFRGEKIKDSPGLLVSNLTGDVRTEMQNVLAKLIEPFRAEDREEVQACLKTQGGLDVCRLSFFEDGDVGDDKVWDNWRLEGPSFVWHFRGDPHVHVWVNIADQADLKLNARG